LTSKGTALSEERERQKADYLRRCYEAVDGLWFVKVEEDLGFARALDLDERVWKIVPKIQARKAKELTGAGDGLPGLAQALALSFEAEGFQVSLTTGPGRLLVSVRACPWVELLRKSQRMHLAEPIARVICSATWSTWAREFGVTFFLDELACSRDGCRLRFSE